MKDKILLCITGKWRDEVDFVEKLSAGTEGRFIATGGHIFDRQKRTACEFNVSPSVEGMEAAFKIGSSAAPIPDSLLDEIARHKSYLSLYAQNNGIAEAFTISEVALAALESGGLAVRVEGSKRASDPDRWREHLQNAQEISPSFLCHLFVWAFVQEAGTYNTIGMPFLGQPDFSIETSDFDTASAIYDEFAKYLLIQQPTVLNGQTIRFEDADGRWRITKANHIYIDDPDIDFSRGMWRLQRISD
ncbi:MAG: hypothetical protein AAF674_10275 [Pseudomonadota bacterium]